MAKAPKGFGSAWKRAAKIAGNKATLFSLLKKAVVKAEENKGLIANIGKDLTALVRLVSAWVTGTYHDVPWKTIVLAVAAILYFVDPFDLIPDFIPVAGFLDDATVVGFVIASIRNDLERFRSWEQAHA